MSSPIRDIVEGYRILGEILNDFIYVSRPKKGIKQEHTKEELEEMLERVRQDCWNSYDTGKYSVLGQD